MARDYKKEAEWEKNKYYRLNIRLEKEKKDKLMEKMEKSNTTVSEWVRDKINELINDK